MPNILHSHGKFKNPKWMKNNPTKHKPFGSRKSGNITFAEQLAIVIIFTILLMILMS